MSDNVQKEPGEVRMMLDRLTEVSKVVYGKSDGQVLTQLLCLLIAGTALHWSLGEVDDEPFIAVVLGKDRLFVRGQQREPPRLP